VAIILTAVIGLGKSLRSMSETELVQYRRSIGVLFQSGALFNSMTVADNVALPLREHTSLPEETIEIVAGRGFEPPPIPGEIWGNGRLLAPHITGTDGMFVALLEG